MAVYLGNEMVSSGGGIGGGSTGGGSTGGGSTGGCSPFIVTLNVDMSSGSINVSDEGKDVMDEIDSNYKAGNPVSAVVTYTVTLGSNPITTNFWLVAVQSSDYCFITSGGTYIIISPASGNHRWTTTEKQIVQS